MRLWKQPLHHRGVLDCADQVQRETDRVVSAQNRRLDRIEQWARRFLNGPDSPTGNALEGAMFPRTGRDERKHS